MCVDGEVFAKSFGEEGACPLTDEELKQLGYEIEALEQYLRVQNLRRLEEERLIEILEAKGGM